jgi:predicted small integral membrane protein
LSKERAKRREVRLAEAEAARTARQRARDRRERRRALLRRVRPALPDRRTGRLFVRRTRGQRAAVAIVALAALVLVWLGVDALSTRIALTMLIAIAIPALTVLVFDRRI